MKRSPHGVVAAALRGFPIRNPAAHSHLKTYRTFPTDPEKLLWILGGGSERKDHRTGLRRMYRTENGTLLKVCSLMREWMGHLDEIPFEKAREAMQRILHDLQGEVRLRQNANRGAGVFPNMKDGSDKNPRTWDITPTPSRAQAEDYRMEERRICGDPLRRYSSQPARPVKDTISTAAQNGVNF